MTDSMVKRCGVCNAELSQCGALGADGEPSLDCYECQLRELADELVQRAEAAEHALRKSNEDIADRLEIYADGLPKETTEQRGMRGAVREAADFVRSGFQNCPQCEVITSCRGRKKCLRERVL